MMAFDRDIGKRPTADELLVHPFVTTHGAAAEAVAAGHQGQLERRSTDAVVPRQEKVLPSSISAHTSAVEEAADQALARQATGLLGLIHPAASGFNRQVLYLRRRL